MGPSGIWAWRLPCPGLCLSSMPLLPYPAPQSTHRGKGSHYWRNPLPRSCLQGPLSHASHGPHHMFSTQAVLCPLLRVKRLYLTLKGWRGWVVHESRCSTPSLLARGGNPSGWALAPQFMWLSPFSFLHTASDTIISTSCENPAYNCDLSMCVGCCKHKFVCTLELGSQAHRERNR